MNLFNDLDKNILREILNKYDYKIKEYRKKEQQYTLKEIYVKIMI